ncbi:MAG: rhomboid family intrarane serine protease [Myxococcaceae bacterium]|nr:rhomboid family intrarane serine protease [Myxococcaceae bacterium]
MRLLRELADERTAQRLVDALADQSIATELKPSEQSYNVWVIDEAHMPRASQLTSSWLDDEKRELFEQSASRGMRARELSARIEERRLRHIEAMQRQLRSIARPRPTPLSWGLIGLCIAVGILTGFGEERSMIALLTIADPRAPMLVSFISVFGVVVPWLPLPLHEPWRFVTPVLVHFDLMHIVFNLLMLRNVSRIIEGTHGVRYLAAFVLVCAVVSNIAQYELGRSPMFAGMSGVVFGLLGLVWLRGKLDPAIGYGLPSSTKQFMIIWLVLGFMGNFGIANWCHLFGLLVGASWAFVAHKLGARAA